MSPAKTAALRCAVGLALPVLLAGAVLRADGTATGPLFRIFLTDGRTLTSYGEYARVGERVVFSLPMGEANGAPRLHLVSVPASQVDWAATEGYRDSARAAHYSASRGEADFAAMSGEVARILNDIARTADRSEQLALAERARQRLADWPREHFGYRSDEVRQILAILDEVVSELRAARGDDRFDLNLVAAVVPPAQVSLLPKPTLQESIQQALTAANLAETPSDRQSLLQSAVALLDAERSSLPDAWARATAVTASRALARELEVTRRYVELQTRALANADRAAARADVHGVERVLDGVRKQDVKLGRQRPDEVRALVAVLEGRLDAAQRFRLARDQWAIKGAALRAYRDAVRRPMEDLDRSQPFLDDIRTLAGPDAGRLGRMAVRLTRGLAKARVVQPPADAQPVHGVLVSALQLASNAARLRQTAVASGDLKTAWDASAAAAGAIMLAARARADLARVLEPPRLQ
jgi:hypothetical protein